MRQRESAVAQAQAAHEMEIGQQAVAEREYQLLGRGATEEDRALMLRQPQLKSAMWPAA